MPVNISWYGYAGVTSSSASTPTVTASLPAWSASAASYRYASTVASQGRVDGDYTGLEAMLGYQKVHGLYPAWLCRSRLRGASLSPANRFDGNSGGHVGGKVRLDAESDFAMPNYVNLIATYSSARDRY